MTKDIANKMLLEEISALFDITISDLNDNLLDQKFGIDTVDFLYLINTLETKYGINICRILETNDSPIFTVNNLAAEIEAIGINENRNN